VDGTIHVCARFTLCRGFDPLAWLTMVMLTPNVASRDLWILSCASHCRWPEGTITVDQSECASAARQRLAGHRFDQAPVVWQERVVGWVLTRSLHQQQAVSSVMTPLDQSAIVSAESSVANALEVLGQHGLVFTAERTARRIGHLGRCGGREQLPEEPKQGQCARHRAVSARRPGRGPDQS
jgi:hypothetical protein